jgi:hypothetical protein
VKYKNPGYPYRIELFDKTWFYGHREMAHLQRKHLLRQFYEPMQEMSSLHRVYFSWSEPDGRYGYDLRVGGFGPAFFVLLIPCLGASLLISLLRRDGRMFFTLATILLSFWAFPHARHWVRMNLFVGVAFTVSIAYLIDLLRTSNAVHLLRSSALLLVVFTLFMGTSDDVVPPSQIKYFLSNPPRLWHSSQFTSGNYEMWIFRKAYEFAEPGTSIAYDKSFKYWFIYPLWNRDFSNKTYYLQYEGELMWKRAMEEWEVDFIVTGVGSPVFRWAIARPGKFKLVIQGPNLALFKAVESAEVETEGQDGAAPEGDGDTITEAADEA